MTVIQTVDLKLELFNLTDLIKAFWINTETVEDFDAMVQEAFEAGLSKGRIWCEEYICYTAGELMSGGKCLEPLKQRNVILDNIHDCAYMYDGLMQFSSYIQMMTSKIWKAKTAYGNWNYSTEADQLLDQLSLKYTLDQIKPKNLTRPEQKQIAESFKGVNSEEAGSISTAEKLTPNNVNYWHDEQAMSYSRCLVSAVFSHGLFSAKQMNTSQLLTILIPIFQEHQSDAFSSNGCDFIELVKGNELVNIMLTLKQPKFHTEADFNQMVTEDLTRKEQIANETEAEAQARKASIDEYHSSLLDEILSPEYEAAERKEEEMFLEKLRQLESELPPFSII
jgi:hypothetical protein